MRFLSRVCAQVRDGKGDTYRASFLRGLRYLLVAQYPNGGWPQVYPLQGSYHDAITYNDNAVAEAAMLLDDVAEGKPDFAFVPAKLRTQAAAASRRAVEVILASQVRVQGKRTIWPQQIDALTLAPTSARNYEPPSLASAESGDILLFLMRQPKPTFEIKEAVRSGITWLKDHEIRDQAWEMTPQGKQILAKPGAISIWSRNYDVVTGKPIFGDRDKSIHNNANELSLERRNGYAWYGSTAQKAIDAYGRWNEKHPT
jgi:PelA/Pel-15E family pectate lyase